MTNRWKTIAKINEASPRASFWCNIFGGYEVPLVSFVPFQCDLPGKPNALAYKLDLNVITETQKEKLVKAIAEKFGYTEDFVRDSLPEHGVPVLVDDVFVTSTDQGLFFSVIDGWDGMGDEPGDEWDDGSGYDGWSDWDDDYP